jgi:predicted nuclease of predicted toxin-antitoxin system
MRFLVDAQLPRRVAYRIADLGHDVCHTLDLKEGNHTSDTEISRLADSEDRIVVTKDSDFVNSHLLLRKRQRILLVTTGNISNKTLEKLLLEHFDKLYDAFVDGATLVELGVAAVVVHR